ncbi:MAG: SocA family protein [Methanobrevibacter sp.]|nr:SocA family protein [Candidatus Methanovirga australis]
MLYKLLYFSDFDYFELNEKSITNETYEKHPYGQFPLTLMKLNKN